MIETFCLRVVVPICLGKDENSIEPTDFSSLFVHHLSSLSLQPSLCSGSLCLASRLRSLVAFPGPQPKTVSKPLYLMSPLVSSVSGQGCMLFSLGSKFPSSSIGTVMEQGSHLSREPLLSCHIRLTSSPQAT